jgi:hypothetical protein
MDRQASDSREIKVDRKGAYLIGATEKEGFDE